MLGRNHALYAAAGWVGAYPYLGFTGAELKDPALFAVSTALAAGCGVLPDLDHPDARPARHFGVLSKLVAKIVAHGAGGHRVGTHSFTFAAALGVATWAAHWLPWDGGRWLATVCSVFCVSLGATLVMPSLGFRVPHWAMPLLAAGGGWYAWTHYDTLRPLLWVLVAGGTVCHILCDLVTRGGVPLLHPWKPDRYAVGLFRVGGAGERVAAVLGLAGLAGAGWLLYQWF